MNEAEIDRALARMEKIAVDASGWLTLYRDTTGGLWEVSYPYGEMQGGGPRQLSRVTPSQAKVRYPSAPISK